MSDEKTRDLAGDVLRLAHKTRETADHLANQLGDIPNADVLYAEAEMLRQAHAALSTLTVPDGDARERLIQLALAHLPVLGVAGAGKVVGCRCMDRVFVLGQETWAEHLADAILAAFPVLSRDIAGEIEAEAERHAGPFEKGLRRAAEIVRNGR